ncbi:MAG TPA: hypothetical protein VGG84_03370 [Gemmatimonadaceae bacterium]
MTAVDHRAAIPSPAERAALYAQVRAELRAEHRRLTERQIDLIAAVAVELRLVRITLGAHTASSSTTQSSLLDPH